MKSSEVGAWVELHIWIGETTNSSHRPKVLAYVNFELMSPIESITHMIESSVLLHEKNYMLDIGDRPSECLSKAESQERSKLLVGDFLHILCGWTKLAKHSNAVEGIRNDFPLISAKSLVGKQFSSSIKD